MSSHQKMADAEKAIKRNPHPDFKKVEASRPNFREVEEVDYTKTPDTEWHWGQGGNDGGKSLEKKHVEIDPYEEGRSPYSNYKLLISGIIPRPIAFVSTVSKDGKSIILALR
jgi:hypothetical protein